MNIKKELLKKIKKADSIVIVAHVNPDGDSVSSSYGLRNFLRNVYPTKKIYSTSTTPKYVSSLFEEREDVIDQNIIDNSLIIMVDVSDLERVEDQRIINSKNIICFDHHILSKENNILTYRDTSYISCTLLLSDFIFSCFKKMDSKTAYFFYIGLTTDSGRFQFNSSSKTLSLASKLVSYDVDYKKIYLELYKQSSEELRWKSYVYSHYKYDGDVSFLIYTLEDSKLNNFDPEIVNGTVNLLSSIDNHSMWAYFIQQEDGIFKVELRSSKKNVQQVALKFNGGGHLLASGCKIDDVKKVQEVLDALNEAKYVEE